MQAKHVLLKIKIAIKYMILFLDSQVYSIEIHIHPYTNDLMAKALSEVSKWGN